MKSKIQLVIPMAGLGSRFANAGYQEKKPLIDVLGKPMISRVVNNLMSEYIGHVILVTTREIFESEDLRAAIGNIGIPISIMALDELSAGPAETVYLAKPLIDQNFPLVIANSDQFVNASLDHFYESLFSSDTAGSILTMQDSDPKWSFAELKADGMVSRIVEKEVISTNATVGIYGFSSAKLAWIAIEQMFNAEDKTNGEFYVGPAYNYLVNSGEDIKIFDLGPVNEVMYGLGIPSDLQLFLESPVAQQIQ